MFFTTISFFKFNKSLPNNFISSDNSSLRYFLSLRLDFNIEDIFLALSFKVFNSDNEIRFVESVLRRKGYIK